MDEVVLRDGRRFVVRPMEHGDAGAVRDGFASLSAESLRLRFFSPVPRLTEGLVADLTAVRPDRIVLLAFAVDGDGAVGGLAGGARAIRSAVDPTRADVAVTVGDRFQRAGLGGNLLRRLARAAAAEGVVALGGHVLVDNAAARRLLRRAGARVELDEPGVLRFEIDVAAAPAAASGPSPARGRRPGRAA